MSWQPIETAPKDGREIIIGWAGHSDMAFAMYDTYKNEWIDEFENDYYDPTHWMKKPEPPCT